MGSPPEIVGKYRLLERLGSCGMGVVYRGQDIETLQQVAVKTVQVVRRPLLWCIRQEIHALSRIRHPGVIRILAHGVDQGVPWYAMELFDGFTLASYLERVWAHRARDAETGEMLRNLADLIPGTTDAPRSSNHDSDGSTTEAISAVRPAGEAVPPAVADPPPEAREAANGQLSSMVTLLRHVAATLAHIHGNGLVHLDLKPSNIFIRPDWTPVIFDFSLASSVSLLGRESLVPGGFVQGTLGYMAPEQFRGETVDARTDLYALGCIIYECVTGHLPYEGCSLEEFSHAHQDLAPTPPSRLAKGLPSELEELILRLLAKRPRDRLGHANDVARILCGLGARDVAWGNEAESRDYLYRPEFVGREQPMRWLETHLDALRAGRGRCVFVGAESGMGKTRLMMEFARVCGRRSIRVVTGQSEVEGPRATDRGEGSRTQALQPFRPLLEAIADHCLELGQTAADRVLGARGKLLAAYEPSIADLPGQSQYPDPPQVETDVHSHRVLHALGETLATFTAEEPIVLILDDMQWFDDLSIAFCSLVQSGAFGPVTVLLVGTYRTRDLPAGLAHVLAGSCNECTMEIGALDEKEVGEVAAGMLGASDPGEPLSRFLTRRSGGNPFFVAEYLRVAVEEKLLRRDAGGKWRLADRPEGVLDAIHRILPLPRSLRDVVIRRLDGLPAKAQRLLGAAALLGQEFEAQLLESCRLLHPADVLEAVGELRRRHILEDAGEGRVRFVHETLREAASQRMDAGVLIRVHRRIASTIERLHADSSGFHRQFSTLARHWDAGEKIDKAIEYYEKAGEQACHVSAYEEACRAFARAFELEARSRGRLRKPVPEHRRAMWHRRIAECELRRGRFARGREHLDKALSLLRCPFPRTRWSLGLDIVGQIARQALRRAWPGSRRVRSRRPPEVLLEVAAAHDVLLRALCCTDGVLPTLCAAVRSARYADLAASPSGIAGARGALASVLAMIPGHRWIAETVLRKAHAAACLPADRLRLLLVEATYRFGRWERTRCREVIDEARELARSTGALGTVDDLDRVLAALCLVEGDFGATAARAKVRQAPGPRRDTSDHRIGLLTICEVQLALGQDEQALKLLSRVERAVGCEPGRNLEIWHQGLLALVLARTARRDAAWRAATRVLSLLASPLPICWQCGRGYAHVASACLHLLESGRSVADTDPRRLLDATRTACRALARVARVFPVCRAQSERLTGSYLFRRGSTRSARRRWTRASRIAREGAMPYEEALALLELSRCAAPGTSARIETLETARRLLERTCGAGKELEAAREALRREG